MAIAFQRMMERMRHSMAGSPGVRCSFGDGVEIGGVRGIRQVGPAAPRLVDESLDEEVGALGALALDHGFERLDPLSGFFWVLVAHCAIWTPPASISQGRDILAPPLGPRHYR
jgi:hypothetical protein